MRNEITPRSSMCRRKTAWRCLAWASVSGFSSQSLAMDNLEVVLDGYAYVVNSEVTISLKQQFIFIAESEIENCQRPNGQLPLNNANLTLITNNQGIGVNQFRYEIASRLLFLTSQTSDLICDNGVFMDQIFVAGFE